MIVLDSMARDYAFLVSEIRTQGQREVSRGFTHREILAPQIRLRNPLYSLATGVGRKLSLPVAWLEGMQLIAGESYPELMIQHAPQFDAYRDGEVFHGAYGPRVAPQIPVALHRLQSDGGSRQAIVTIWDPLYDSQDRRDLPCTLSMQFMVRGGRLSMVTTMRSNDVWLGFPYDVFQFTLLQKTMANCLGIRAGDYVHTAGSMHLYETNIDASMALFSRPATDEDEVEGIHSHKESVLERWRDCVSMARDALEGRVRPDQKYSSSAPMRTYNALV